MSHTPSIATTEWGRVSGRHIDGVHVFKGIRYGATTAGANRFAPPRPPAGWTGVADAVQEGPQCFQIDPGRRPDQLELPESEDCLRLNVWTTGLADGGRRPVLVWLHGGGLWRGSAAGAWEDWPGDGRGRADAGAINSNEGPFQEGRELARGGDVVVVSPNHRINVMGFLHLEHRDPDFAGSGNAGLLDLVAALEWVRANIAAFGGDPGNVTIFGLSGGGQKVSLLMAMPGAAGLFHKAIIMSGPAPRVLDRAEAVEVADRILHRLELDHDVRQVRNLPPRAILSTYYADAELTRTNTVWGIVEGVAPVVDGRVLTQQPFWDTAPECSRDVPLIIGHTATEMTEFILSGDPAAHLMDWADAESRLGSVLGAQASSLLGQLRRNHPDASPWLVYSLALAQWPTGAFSTLIAERKARQGGAPVFTYRTDWRTPVRGGALMSPHAIDSSFALRTVDSDTYSNGGGPAPAAMAELVSSAWVSFARTGRPRAEGLPDWPPYAEPARPTMLFDLPSQVVPDPDGADRAAFARYLAGYRKGLSRPD